jgi:hypothetical protein
MNLAFALDFIPRRMNELGFGEDYITRYRHVLVEDNATLTFNAYNQFMYFITPEEMNLSIRSKRGVFNLTDYSINEQQHEHSGKIEVINQTGQNQYVLFIQVIPKNKSKTKKA